MNKWYTQPPPEHLNNTTTDIILGGAWCNRIVAQQENCNSTASTDEHINEGIATANPPPH